jgi:hypothetical protein
MDARFNVNDWVVYTREKHGLSPGPRAKNISPSPNGDLYSYEVDKYWVVRQILEDALILETRTGKFHEMPRNDRRLRHATWWERLFYSDRFPSRTPVQKSDADVAPGDPSSPPGQVATIILGEGTPGHVVGKSA